MLDYGKYVSIASMKPWLETPHSVPAVKSHHQDRLHVCALLCGQLSAGSKMHSGDQQSPVAQEGKSLAAELGR